MDISQSLKDAENTLRDFISDILVNKYGNNWIDKCKISKDRTDKWSSRKDEEIKKQKFGTVEKRLIYYADFYDIKTILKKNWDLFSEALGEWKVIEVWLNELERFRNPDAHRRELLPHQKQLAAGITGEIRTRIVRYRSKLENVGDYFPKLESVRDNYGNIWSAGELKGTLYTKVILRPGDILEYVITATDPLGEDLNYGITINPHPNMKYQKDNTIRHIVTAKDIGRLFNLNICIKSNREYHAIGDLADDWIEFSYTVLPPK